MPAILGARPALRRPGPPTRRTMVLAEDGRERATFSTTTGGPGVKRGLLLFEAHRRRGADQRAKALPP
jgi:hypothetical protein